MFEHLRECLDEFDRVYKRYEECGYDDDLLTPTEQDILQFHDLYLAKAIIKDREYGDKGETVANIILAARNI